MPGYAEADEGSGDSGVMAATGPSRDAVKKLDQIIQVSLKIHGAEVD
jgi:autophagy-related protein 13